MVVMHQLEVSDAIVAQVECSQMIKTRVIPMLARFALKGVERTAAVSRHLLELVSTYDIADQLHLTVSTHQFLQGLWYVLQVDEMHWILRYVQLCEIWGKTGQRFRECCEFVFRHVQFHQL